MYNAAMYGGFYNDYGVFCEYHRWWSFILLLLLYYE